MNTQQSKTYVSFLITLTNPNIPSSFFKTLISLCKPPSLLQLSHKTLSNFYSCSSDFLLNMATRDMIECANALAELLNLKQHEVLIESTGVIGQRIKKEALLNSLPKLVNSLSSTVKGADSAAVAITTTDLVSKSVAIESEVGGAPIRIGGMAKGSGMIHPNMATMLGVITTDAMVTSDVWRKMVQVAVNRSFNQITVDGDSSTNDTVIALASGLSGSSRISSLNTADAKQLQACLDAVMQGLAKSIAWDGEGATCLIEVTVTGAKSEAEAAKVARSVASSSLAKAAVYGQDPNWGRIACAAYQVFDESLVNI